MADKKWFLKGKLKDNSPWFIPLDKNEITIGRSNDCSLILQDPLRIPPPQPAQNIRRRPYI